MGERSFYVFLYPKGSPRKRKAEKKRLTPVFPAQNLPGGAALPPARRASALHTMTRKGGQRYAGQRERGKEGRGRRRDRSANGLILLALSLYWVPGIWGDAAPAPAQADGPSTQNQASAQSPAAEPSLTNPEPARVGGTGEARDLLEKLEETRQENPDTVGWLWVPGAGVDQPVMQTPGGQRVLPAPGPERGIRQPGLPVFG